MANDSQQKIFYKRARFKTSLPIDRLYSKAHYWLAEDSPGTYRVGFTKFATRMLGDFVELQFDVSDGDPIEVGQPIGNIEGFKAVSQIYCVAAGRFAGPNQKLILEPTLLETQPYESGWLYRITQSAAQDLLDVHAYIELLDATIDQMLQSELKSREKSC